jgi:prephenate dehydrogenase
VLTPVDRSELETAPAREFIGWVKAIGAVPLSLSAEEHDRIVSLTSHLPQLASTALAATLAERLGAEEQLQVAGPGLRDAIRLATSPYEVWGDILKTNTGEIEEALGAYIAKLVTLRGELCSERMREEFRVAGEFASRLKR